MQKKTLPIALGTMLCALFVSNSAQATSLPYNRLHATGTPITYAERRGVGGADASNYVADVTGMGRIVWPADRMPLKVYIADGDGTMGYRDYYPDLMRKALNEWQTKTSGKISWQEVNSPAQANITCIWTANAKPNGPGVEAGETKSTVGINRFTGEQNIMRANISVLTSLMGNSFSDTDMYKTCLHEVGHAIGMEGHSNTPSDIMYPVLNNAQTPYLKDRDVNTIAALYSEETRHLAQAPGFQPQFGQRYMPRQFAQPWQGRQIDSDDDGIRPFDNQQGRTTTYRPRGRYRMAPVDLDSLSYEQRDALLRALREKMQRRAYMRNYQ